MARMSKDDTQRALVPRLRFPEFRGNPFYNISLGDVTAESTVRKGAKMSAASVMGVRKDEGIVPMEERLIAADTSRYKVVQKDWFAYNPMRLNIGSIARSHHDDDVLVSPDYVVFRCLEEDPSPSLSPDYLDHFRQSIHWDGFVTEAGDGGVRIRIYYATLKQLRLAVPEIAEQRKIADCLGSLDDLLAAEGRKLATLRDHKQGLMQKLFPREGETQPRLRFPEFRNAGEWGNHSFESLYEFKPNNTYSRDQLNYDEGAVRNIHYGDIHTRFATHFHVSAEVLPYVNAEILPDDVNPESFCQPGDVIFTDASEDLADVGKCIEIIDVADEFVLSGSHTILARPRASSMAVGFAGYLFKSRPLRAGIEKEAQGTKVTQISPTRLAKIDVLFPPDEGEQHRIADCLSTLDARIAAQSAKLDALRSHKRGLMQQLFPSPAGAAT